MIEMTTPRFLLGILAGCVLTWWLLFKGLPWWKERGRQ